MPPWQRRTNVWRRVTSPPQRARRLRICREEVIRDGQMAVQVRRRVGLFLWPPREAAMTAFAKSWRRGWKGLQWELEEAVHVDHRACLPHPVHGLHNFSVRCIWHFDAALRGGVQNGARPVQILRDGGRTDIRRPWHDRYWAGPTVAAADPWQGSDTRIPLTHGYVETRARPR